MRTIIEVPESVVHDLDRIGKQQRKSRAAIIREAIQLYLARKPLKTSDEAFGVWEKKGREGLKYQEHLRTEWSE